MRTLHAMSLVEVLIAVAIVSIVGLSILAAIQAGIYFQQSIREENAATRAAADIIERQKRELFVRLQPGIVPVNLDGIPGEAEVRFYAPENGQFVDGGQPVGPDEMNPIPNDRSMLIVEVTVRWNRAGRIRTGQRFGADGEFNREVVLATLMAP